MSFIDNPPSLLFNAVIKDCFLSGGIVLSLITSSINVLGVFFLRKLSIIFMLNFCCNKRAKLRPILCLDGMSMITSNGCSICSSNGYSSISFLAYSYTASIVSISVVNPSAPFMAYNIGQLSPIGLHFPLRSL